MPLTYSWSLPKGSAAHYAFDSSGDAFLSWDSVADAIGYKVYYGVASGDYLQQYGSGISVGNVTTYTITGLDPGTYYVAITAIDSDGFETGYSNEQVKTV